jgi:transposase-like protein
MKVLQYRSERAESEGARRASEDSARWASVKVPDSEVEEKARRRQFTADYKLRILREADACVGDGDIGALLRREGLYFSHLSAWRRQRDEIARAELSSRKPGRKARRVDSHMKELERDNARLRRQLKKAEVLLDIQKKASELLGLSLKDLSSEESD